MATETIRIEGLAGVLKTLRELPEEIVSKNGGPVRTALARAASKVQKQAQANVDAIVVEPNKGGLATKSTGALRDSITTRRLQMPAGQRGERFWVGIAPLKAKYANTRKNRRKQRVGKFYVILPPTYYGYFLELGTERQSAKPFMRPAYESQRLEALQTFGRELPAAIARIQKRLERKNGVA